MNDKNENKKRKRGLPTQMNLVIRVVAGVYLLYLAYSIYNSLQEIQGTEKFIFLAAIVLFGAIGAAVAFFSLRSMTRGEYAGGAADAGREEEETAEEEKVSEDRIRFEEPQAQSEKRPERPTESKQTEAGEN